MGDEDQRRPFFPLDVLKAVPERDDLLGMSRADQLALVAQLLTDAESAHVPYPIEHLVDHAVAVRNIAEVQRVKDATGLRVASIYGSARLDGATHPAAFNAVRRLASGLVRMGFVPLCGGGDGLMAAASQGAHEGAEKLGRADREAASFAINVILEREQELNAFAQRSAASTRHRAFGPRIKFMNGVADAFIFGPGGWGSAEEFGIVASEVQNNALKVVPIAFVRSDEPTADALMMSWYEVMVDRMEALGTISPEDRRLILPPSSPAAILGEIDRFYTNFVDSRLDGPDVVLELIGLPDVGQLERVNAVLECGGRPERFVLGAGSTIVAPRTAPGRFVRQIIDEINTFALDGAGSVSASRVVDARAPGSSEPSVRMTTGSTRAPTAGRSLVDGQGGSLFA